LVGGLGGLAASAILGWGLFKTTLRLDLRRFFQVTGFLLLLFAAGLVAQGVHEFNEAGLIPTLREPIWDLSQVLGETTPAGSLLKALFGYNANPSLTEALAYVGYLVTLALALRPARPKSTGMAPAPNP
jgi:high-affinity iron transporter